MTIIAKQFPHIPETTAPVKIALSDDPIGLDWFKVTIVWFKTAALTVNIRDIFLL